MKFQKLCSLLKMILYQSSILGSIWYFHNRIWFKLGPWAAVPKQRHFARLGSWKWQNTHKSQRQYNQNNRKSPKIFAKSRVSWNLLIPTALTCLIIVNFHKLHWLFLTRYVTTLKFLINDLFVYSRHFVISKEKDNIASSFLNNKMSWINE